MPVVARTRPYTYTYTRPSRISGSGEMPFALFPLSKLQLEQLAASHEPQDLAVRAEHGAFPPPFVAARTLKLAAEAEPGPWSTAFLIMRTEDLRVVGACGFKTGPKNGRVEVGYGVAPAARGNGAATVALTLLAEIAFEAGVSEVLAEVLPENKASIRVVQKAGFARAGSRTDEDNEYVIQWLCRRGTPRRVDSFGVA